MGGKWGGWGAGKAGGGGGGGRRLARKETGRGQDLREKETALNCKVKSSKVAHHRL